MEAYTDSVLDMVKKKELGILEAFISVCEKMNLKYYLAYGTLLGAVRHHGFIPWDDDIDVVMMRKDYEAFIKEGQKLLPEYYFIQTNKTDPEYKNPYAKIRDTRTTMIEISVKNRHMNHGIYIDIFPLDYIPDDENVRKRFLFFNFFATRRIWAQYKKAAHKTMKESLKMLMCFLLFPTVSSAIRCKEKAADLPESDRVAFLQSCGRGVDRNCTPVEWFEGDETHLMFEHINARVPSKYDAVLSARYGDYMKLPPKEQQIPHHFCTVLDPNQSYLEYMQERS